MSDYYKLTYETIRDEDDNLLDEPRIVNGGYTCDIQEAKSWCSDILQNIKDKKSIGISGTGLYYCYKVDNFNDFLEVKATKVDPKDIKHEI